MAIATAFWNNKGGTGKTSLAFQAICAFAQRHPKINILVIDVCPQANLSELLLGGLEGNGSTNLFNVQSSQPRASVGGYFQSRLPRPYDPNVINCDQYLIIPANYNQNIPSNITLLAGDPLLELQSNAMSTLANNQIPGTDTWVKIVSWLRDFMEDTEDRFDYVFIDANPSFSIYTQVALAAVSRVVLPIMADDSSRRAIQNAFSLIYGLQLPSEIYSQHMFATKMNRGQLSLPKAHVIVKNRITQYMGAASGYRAVLDGIEDDIRILLNQRPEHITFDRIEDGVIEIRDFQTTGVVSFASGTPFYALQPGRRTVGGQRVALDRQQISDRRDEVQNLARMLV